MFNETFQDLLLKVQTSSNLKSINIDMVSNIKIKNNPNLFGKDTDAIKVSPDMKLISCQDFGCKYIEFSVETSHGEVEPNVVACYPSNIFAKMMAQNKVQLPPKPKDKDNWTGPQKLYSDLIDWA